MPNLSLEFWIGTGVAILLAILAFGVGVGMDARTKGEYWFVIVCFCLSWLAIVATIGLWYFNATTPPFTRAMVSGIFVAIVSVGAFVAITWATDRHNRAIFVEKGQQTSPSQSATTTQPKASSEQPKSDLKLKIDRLIPMYGYKQLVGLPGKPIAVPQGREPTAKDVDTYAAVVGTIVNDRDVQATAGYWEMSAQLADGRFINVELVVPTQDLVINHPHDPPDFIRVQDYWPRKLDMRSIPAHGLSYGFVLGVLRSVTPTDFNKPGNSVMLCFQDSGGQRICGTIKQEDRPVPTMPQQP